MAESKKAEFFWGTGRRKTSVARVRLRAGNGQVVINDKPLNEYFQNDQDRAKVLMAFQTTQSDNKFDVFANVQGGGMTGQSGAVSLGIARALKDCTPTVEVALRDAGLLTRDSRMKERKKYGQRGARRRFQFSKR